MPLLTNRDWKRNRINQTLRERGFVCRHLPPLGRFAHPQDVLLRALLPWAVHRYTPYTTHGRKRGSGDLVCLYASLDAVAAAHGVSLEVKPYVQHFTDDQLALLFAQPRTYAEAAAMLGWNEDSLEGRVRDMRAAGHIVQVRQRDAYQGSTDRNVYITAEAAGAL